MCKKGLIDKVAKVITNLKKKMNKGTQSLQNKLHSNQSYLSYITYCAKNNTEMLAH